MKKVIVSLLVLAFVALAATGTVSAQCAAKPATSTSAATVCAQCTSCVTSTCCTSCCPTTCCCPTVACCVVTQCCEVRTIAAVPVFKPVYKAMPAVVTSAVATPAVAVAAKGGAAAAGEGSSASSITQVSKQSISTGAINVNGTDNTVNLYNENSQTASSSQVNVVLNHVNINPAVAWDNSTATTTTK
ncbi:MAG: hypothetical protein ABSD89_11635 [Halobacteriota archaeon]